MSRDIIETVRQHALDRTRIFLKRPNGSSLSYADMLDRTGQYANALRRLGVSAGDRCAIQTQKTEQAIYIYLACLRLGAAYLPLNPAYTASELEYFLGNAEPSILICEPERLTQLARLGEQAGVQAIETLGEDGTGSIATVADACPSQFVDVTSTGDDLAAILYTSGTTGRSKGVMLSRYNLWANADSLCRAWQFTSADVLLHALPIFHTHGLFVATNVTLLSGAAMLFLPRFDAGQVLDLLSSASVMMGVPTFYTRLLTSTRLDQAATSSIRLFVSGSAPLSAQTHADWQARTGHDILERYGMTETNMLTSNPYAGERRAGTVGKPLEGVSLRIAEPDSGKILDEGSIGVIEVTGPSVFKQYWRAPEKTAAEFRSDGYFITGDLGLKSSDGYVSIVGRGKDLVITGGLNVYPAEVENVLDAQPDIAASAVIGVPHADFGEVVVAVVTVRPGRSLQEALVRAEAAQVLAKFKVPKRIIVESELPYNSMGKVQKNILRDRYRTLFSEDVSH